MTDNKEIYKTELRLFKTPSDKFYLGRRLDALQYCDYVSSQENESYVTTESALSIIHIYLDKIKGDLLLIQGNEDEIDRARERLHLTLKQIQDVCDKMIDATYKPVLTDADITARINNE